MRRALCLSLSLLALNAWSADATVATVEVSGPNEVMTHFLDYAHDGDFIKAAEYLTLDFLPVDDRDDEGPRLARRFMFLIDQYVAVNAEELAKPTTLNRVTIGTLPLGRLQVPLELVERGERWLVSPRTVRSIDPLFTQHGSPLWEKLPNWLVARSLWILGRWQWIGLVLLLALGMGIARGLTAIFTPLFRRLSKLTKSTIDDQLIETLERPSRFMLFLIMLAVGSRALAFPLDAQDPFDSLIRSMAIAVGAWGLFALAGVLSGEILRRARDRDELASRAVRTQVSMMHRVVNAVVVVVAGALMLLQFPAVRSIGMSMLASAGVAGVVIGLAAQRSIGNLLAGIQLSFTQPIRIGDTVIVEGEWGTIEDITLTYVVIKVWDLRRLVVPVSYFLEKPFQNWTRTSPEIVGSVFIWADYRVDVDTLRTELKRIVEPERGKLWNGTTMGLQVTNATDRAVELRVLVSSDNASKAWDLRCLVREQMLAFMRQQHPGVLPRVRTEYPNFNFSSAHPAGEETQGTDK